MYVHVQAFLHDDDSEIPLNWFYLSVSLKCVCFLARLFKHSIGFAWLEIIFFGVCVLLPYENWPFQQKYFDWIALTFGSIIYFDGKTWVLYWYFAKLANIF